MQAMGVHADARHASAPLSHLDGCQANGANGKMTHILGNGLRGLERIGDSINPYSADPRPILDDRFPRRVDLGGGRGRASQV